MQLAGLTITLTERCNLACGHCGAQRFRNGACGTNSKELSRFEIRSVLLQAKKLGCSSVAFSGGEPLLRQDLPNILDDAETAGLRFTLLTNGLLLNRALIRRFRAYEHLTCVRLSLDAATNRLMRRIRGIHGSRDTVLDAARQLVDAGIRVGFNTTLLPENLLQLPQIAIKARKTGASFLRAIPVLPSGNASRIILPERFLLDCMRKVLETKTEFERISFGPLVPFSERASLIHSLVGSCYGGTRIASLDATGRLGICPIVDMGLSRSTVRRTPLDALLAHTAHRASAVRRLLLTSNIECRRCPDCGTCKGGCLAEWWARRNQALSMQPMCIRRLLPLALKGLRENDAKRRMLSTLFSQERLRSIFSGGTYCIRALPFWTVNFSL